MGKEAKIGLTIIGILVIVFAVVLGQRMLGSRDDSKVALSDKKTSQAKKETEKKSSSLKKSRLSLFNTSKKKSTKSSTKGKATSALAVSRNLHGSSGASGQSADIWSRNRTTATNTLMPQSGSSSLDTYQRAGSPRAGVALLGSPPQSPYAGQSGASDSRYANSSSAYATRSPRGYDGSYASKNLYGSAGRVDSSRQSTNSRYAASDGYNSNAYKSSGYGTPGHYQAASVAPKVGDARLNSSRSYGRAGSTSGSSAYGASSYGMSAQNNSSYAGDSRYKSTSYDSSRYGVSSSGRSDYNHSDYGGGAQSDGTYIVKPHQNYWAISKDVYGTGAYFKALAEANRGSIPDENRLKVGDRIKTPDLAQLEQTYAELCPVPERRETMRKRAELASSGPLYGGSEHQYIVQTGDTLYDIARYELGDAARWTEIYEVNRQILQDSFDYLTPGLKLTMPSKDVKSSASGTAYGSSSKYGRSYGESSSPYRTQADAEAPRTASRPSYETSSMASRPASGYRDSNYGGATYRNPSGGGSGYYGSSSKATSSYGSSNYNHSTQQPARATYPRY